MRTGGQLSSKMVINTDGSLQKSDIYRAHVRNHAKLAYNSVAHGWKASGHARGPFAAVPGLDKNVAHAGQGGARHETCGMFTAPSALKQ